jgi:hypothetical protein
MSMDFIKQEDIQETPHQFRKRHAIEAANGGQTIGDMESLFAGSSSSSISSMLEDEEENHY